MRVIEMRENTRLGRAIDSLHPVTSRLGCYALFRKHFRSTPVSELPDAVCVPYLDCCDKAIAVLGSPFSGRPWTGVVMSHTFHLRRMGIQASASRTDGIEAALFKRMLRLSGLRQVFAIDEALCTYVQQTWGDEARKLTYLADPVDCHGNETREAARKALNIAPARRVVLAYGAMDPRKGVNTLLNAVTDTDMVLLLAGSRTSYTEALLDTPESARLRRESRLVVLDGYLTAEQEWRVFQASDVVWVGYEGFDRMSAVLAQAACMGRPVIGCANGLVGWLTRRHALGQCIDAGCVEAAKAALMACCLSTAGAAAKLAGSEFAARHAACELGPRICAVFEPEASLSGAGLHCDDE